mmetsp:Transcript_11969/g.25910  ORF Transcript_11969/g.25910 Transcript_11969/m.25910 type:complete len:207 (+) Transcript_11969:1757-2377(+)
MISGGSRPLTASFSNDASVSDEALTSSLPLRYVGLSTQPIFPPSCRDWSQALKSRARAPNGSTSDDAPPSDGCDVRPNDDIMPPFRYAAMPASAIASVSSNTWRTYAPRTTALYSVGRASGGRTGNHVPATFFCSRFGDDDDDDDASGLLLLDVASSVVVVDHKCVRLKRGACEHVSAVNDRAAPAHARRISSSDGGVVMVRIDAS